MKRRVLENGSIALTLALVLFRASGCGDSTHQGSGGDASVHPDASTSVDSGAGTDGGGYTCSNPHPAWLLCEDFEAGGGDFETWLAGSDFNSSDGEDDRGRIDLASDQVRSGSYALYMPAAPGSGFQGASLDWRKCLGDVQQTPCDTMDSYTQLFFRVWVRFAEDHRYVHHFLNIGGSQPDRFWSLGSAGCMPTGELSMGTTVDFEPDTHMSYFYTYFPGMECSTNCVDYMGQQWVEENCQHCADIGMPTCEQELRCCWGNEFHPAEPTAFPVGRWFCFEMMMQANDPNVPNGVMAYWVDGQLVQMVDSMMWRTVPELALNRVSLQHYITTSDADDHSNRVWFDDVVVSTERIGCD